MVGEPATPIAAAALLFCTAAALSEPVQCSSSLAGPIYPLPAASHTPRQCLGCRWAQRNPAFEHAVQPHPVASDICTDTMRLCCSDILVPQTSAQTPSGCPAVTSCCLRHLHRHHEVVLKSHHVASHICTDTMRCAAVTTWYLRHLHRHHQVVLQSHPVASDICTDTIRLHKIAMLSCQTSASSVCMNSFNALMTAILKLPAIAPNICMDTTRLFNILP